MAVRTDPKFEFSGASECLYETLDDIISKSTYRVPYFKPVDHKGEVVNVEMSAHTKVFVEKIDSLELEFEVRSQSRKLSPSGPYVSCCNISKEYADTISSNNIATPLDAIIKVLSAKSYVIDAAAQSYLLTMMAVRSSNVLQKLRNTSEIAGLIAASHMYAHSDMAPLIVSRVPKHLDSFVELQDIFSRIEMVTDILKLCSKVDSRESIPTSVEESLQQPVNMFSLSSIDKACDLSSGLIISLLLKGRLGELRDVCSSLPDHDIKWELSAAATSVAIGNGLGIYYKAAYITSLGEITDNDQVTHETQDCIDAVMQVGAVLSEEINKSRNLQAAFMNGVGYCVASRQGVVIFSEPGTNAMVVSRTDLKTTLELLKEVAGTFIALLVEEGKNVATKFYKCWYGTCVRMKKLDDYEVSRCAVFQRDLDLAFKNRLMGDILRDESSPSKALQSVCLEHGRPSEAMSGLISDLLTNDNKDNYMYIRAMRCIPPTWYNPVEFAMESVRCYHLGAEAEPETLDRFESYLKSFIAQAHYKLTGNWPRGVLELLDKEELDTQIKVLSTKVIPISIMSKWVPNGEGLEEDIWCDGAVRTRDKTNVVLNVAESMCYEDVYDREPSETREVLHFIGQDPVVVAGKYIKEVKTTTTYCIDGTIDISKAKIRPVVIVPKPEQKQNSRVVAMEDCHRRKGNSVMNNNALTLADTHPGSLLGASASKLENIEKRNTAGVGANMIGNLWGKAVNCMVGVDFTKFGHFIAFLLQLRVAKLLDLYYGQEWMEKHMALNKKQVIVIPTNGFFIKFMNVQGGDGQGLRNGNWQLMVGALGMMAYDDLRSKIVEIPEANRIFLSYFMDDNNFMIPLSIPKAMRDTNAQKQFIRKKMKLAIRILEDTYGRAGLKAESSKMIISTRAYGQTGDVYNESGKIHIPAKSAVGCLVEPSIRAPSILDMIQVADNTGQSMAANRSDPVSAYIMVLISSAFHFVNFTSYGRTVDTFLASVALAMPRFLGGLGVKPMTALLYSKGVYNDDEALISIVRHVRARTQIGRIAEKFLCLDEIKGDEYDWFSSPVYKPRRDTPNLGNSLLEKLEEGIGSNNSYNLPQLRKHLEETSKSIVQLYDTMPTTMPSAFIKAHPYSATKAEVAMFSLSSTAQSILPSGEIEKCRKVNVVRFHNYVSWIVKLRTPSQAKLSKHRHTDRSSLVELGWKGRFVTLHGMHRFLSLESLEQCDSCESHIEIIKRDHRHGVSSLTQSHGVSSYVDIGHVWITPPIASIVSMTDIAEAAKTSGDGDNGVMHIIATRTLDLQDTKTLVTKALRHSPYISIPELSFVPPVNAQSLVSLSNTRSSYMLKLDSMLGNMPNFSHVNYMQLSAVAMVQNAYFKEKPIHFAVRESCMWLEPLVSLTDNRALPKVKTPKLPLMFRSKGLREALFLSRQESGLIADTEDAVVQTDRALELFDAMEKLAYMSHNGLENEKAFSTYSSATLETLSTIFADELSNSANGMNKIYFAFCGTVASVVYTSFCRTYRDASARLLYVDTVLDEAYDPDTVLRDIQPDEIVVENLAQYLKDKNPGAYQELEEILIKKLMKASMGNPIEGTASLSEKLCRLACIKPKWWKGVMRSRITAVAIKKVNESSRLNLSSFYIQWSLRYHVKYCQFREAVRAYLEQFSDKKFGGKRATDIVDSYKVLNYHSLWCGYKLLSDSVRTREYDDNESSMFMDGLLKPFARYAWKHKVPKRYTGSISSYLEYFKSQKDDAKRCYINDAALSVLKIANKTFIDLGQYETSFDEFISYPIGFYSADELKECKPEMILSEDKINQFSFNISKLICISDIDPQRIPKQYAFNVINPVNVNNQLADMHSRVEVITEDLSEERFVDIVGTQLEVPVEVIQNKTKKRVIKLGSVNDGSSLMSAEF